MHLKPARLPFGPRKAFWRGQVIIWPLVVMISCIIGQYVLQFKLFSLGCKHIYLSNCFYRNTDAASIYNFKDVFLMIHVSEVMNI